MVFRHPIRSLPSRRKHACLERRRRCETIGTKLSLKLEGIYMRQSQKGKPLSWSVKQL
jgi:hypothetical protein